MTPLEQKAKDLATELHEGQYRKDNITSYITHPEAVVQLLYEIGITDENTICAAWLHDSIEDCDITYNQIKEEFNEEIADMVQTLTRDVNREEYKQRIRDADYHTQMIKLADTIHNCETLTDSIPEGTIRRKVDDSLNFYIPLAEEICPKYAELLKQYIKPWKDIIN